MSVHGWDRIPCIRVHAIYVQLSGVGTNVMWDCVSACVQGNYDLPKQ